MGGVREAAGEQEEERGEQGVEWGSSGNKARGVGRDPIPAMIEGYPSRNDVSLPAVIETFPLEGPASAALPPPSPSMRPAEDELRHRALRHQFFREEAGGGGAGREEEEVELENLVEQCRHLERKFNLTSR